jgi:hypothetical protein
LSEYVCRADDTWTAEPCHSFWIFYSLDRMTHEQPTLTCRHMAETGFLAMGLYERLMAGLLTLSLGSSFGGKVSLLKRAVAVVWLCGQRVRLLKLSDTHCIRVDVEKGSPLAVCRHVTELLEATIRETARGLKYSLWLSSPPSSSAVAPAATSSSFSSPSPPDFLSLQAVQAALTTSSDVASADQLFTVSHAAISSSHSAWLEPSGGHAYDAFLSYRWGKEDGDVCQSIFAGMGGYNVTPARRPVVLFKDTVRLQCGMNFLQGFCAALLRSRVIVPLVTDYSLLRMRTHKPHLPDYTLMEWVLAIHLHDSDPHIHRVYPLFLGTVTDAETGCRSALNTVRFNTFPGKRHTPALIFHTCHTTTFIHLGPIALHPEKQISMNQCLNY